MFALQSAGICQNWNYGHNFYAGFSIAFYDLILRFWTSHQSPQIFSTSVIQIKEIQKHLLSEFYFKKIDELFPPRPSPYYGTIWDKCNTFSMRPRTPGFEGLEHFPPSVWIMSAPSSSSNSASFTCYCPYRNRDNCFWFTL